MDLFPGPITQGTSGDLEGRGGDKNGSSGLLNDLWRYDPATGEWTWMAGSDTVGQIGIFGRVLVALKIFQAPERAPFPGLTLWATSGCLVDMDIINPQVNF